MYGAGRTVTSTFSLPMTSGRLEEIVVNLGRSGLREIAPDDVQLAHTDALQLGTDLDAALFDDVIGPAYAEAERVAAVDRRGVRLTLSLGGTPELLGVPWEMLYRRRRFLASQRHTPIVRYLEVGDIPPPLPIDGPTRVLGVVASPSGLAPLDVADERARVAKALDGMIERGLVELEWCDPATPRSLRHCLADGTFHILHFVGHSDFDASGNGVLYLLDEDDGTPAPVTDNVLTALLGDQTSLRLVVLNSCKGARTSLTDPFSGIATGLVALGLPAVVAMQFSISDEAAIVFADELFTSLIGRQYAIDAAVSEARKAVFAEVNEIEWATPVLFLRTFDGLLFNFAAAPESIPLKVAPLSVIVVDDSPTDPAPPPAPGPREALPPLDMTVDPAPAAASEVLPPPSESATAATATPAASSHCHRHHRRRHPHRPRRDRGRRRPEPARSIVDIAATANLMLRGDRFSTSGERRPSTRRVAGELIRPALDLGVDERQHFVTRGGGTHGARPSTSLHTRARIASSSCHMEICITNDSIVSPFTCPSAMMHSGRVTRSSTWRRDAVGPVTQW